MRAYSVKNVLDAKFKTLPFDGRWKAAIGTPELTGSWIVYGPPKNGKTSFAMMLAKYMTNFGRVLYNSIEEGLSQSVQSAYRRVNMDDVSGRIILEKELIDDMIKRLKKSKSPQIIFIDSVQFMEMKFSEYRDLKEMFPHKLFIYISHIEGKKPEGTTARRIWRDANVSIYIEGFRAFPVGRYNGEGYIDINKERAAEYWINK
jgi:hypothetical protein